MDQDIQQVKRQIFDELTKIVDPEIGVSIMELELIDKVDIKEGNVILICISRVHSVQPFSVSR